MIHQVQPVDDWMLFGPAGLVAGCQRRSSCEGSNRGWEEDEAGWPGGGAAGRRSVARRPVGVCVRCVEGR